MAFCVQKWPVTRLDGSPSCLQGANFEVADARLENREAVIADIEKAKPTHVLNCAGITGRPNVDWCEDHKVRGHSMNRRHDWCTCSTPGCSDCDCTTVCLMRCSWQSS
jgi:hypothetical protein